MALRHIGNNISVNSFIDNYLDKQSFPFDPNTAFGGSPYSSYGYGCYAPVIKKALDRILSGKTQKATQLSGVSLSELCSKYIDNNIPVIIWATMYMNPPYISSSWYYNGKTIQWIAPEHCLLLVGYDDNHYIFNDPLQNKQTYYNKVSVENAYAGLGRQAIIITSIQEKINNYFDYKNYDKLKSELIECVDNDLSWIDYVIRWHSSEEALDIVLKNDKFVTQKCNQVNIPKAFLQTVFFREQRFVWFQDDVADSVVIASYNYDGAYEEWLKNPIYPAPIKPVMYRHDSSTGLCQIFASTAIKSINYALKEGFITDERIYDSQNLEDLKYIWFKLKDDDIFNLKCGILTLLYEAFCTLGYSRDFEKYTDYQKTMVFTKYNSVTNLPNEYGKECLRWYKIFDKYN